MYSLHTAATLFSVVFFFVVVFWAWSSRRKDEFREAELLPFIDEPEDAQ
ncbi:MAG: CcoQ/FixQ family Cbb3-type cytochrome c oxidase assembly chaperone [Burkholderiales bacterium]|nr:CcoQ/FixQ family Cbb3-type cytochrome c oxidase assembly chaperone [Burkholderiales bacterium]MDE1927442.1 CcoQ/FixQ family Cbb3-type cytochrome c oxidase assembly chaperone [Burkholderiales bacterium]MDE2161016.1 CcoQ/FixQ family Cbb3-type cytochrome c oxidase assembly chaperone [Burkholderiales bacterium]MDE2502441.1 CcoQ/FixQ family Cbb3-type cytochrome c oxidase assembly chaperone [Burkholderiales bacterium]